MQSVEAEGFRRLLILILQCWFVDLLLLKQNGSGRVFSGGISALAVLPEDGII